MAASSERYGRLSIILHWITLALLIGVYARIELREMYPRGSDLREALNVQRDNTLRRMKLSRG